MPVGVLTIADIRLRLLRKQTYALNSKVIFKCMCDGVRAGSCVIPGKLQYIKKLICLLFSSLRNERKKCRHWMCKHTKSSGSLLMVRKHTHTNRLYDDWMWRSCSKNKAQTFGTFYQRSFIWKHTIIETLVKGCQDLHLIKSTAKTSNQEILFYRFTIFKYI